MSDKTYLISVPVASGIVSAIVVASGCHNPTEQLDVVEADLAEQGIRGKVLFDLLLCNASRTNRFYSAEFDGTHFVEERFERADELVLGLEPALAALYKDHFSVINPSLLSPAQRWALKKGIFVWKPNSSAATPHEMQNVELLLALQRVKESIEEISRDLWNTCNSSVNHIARRCDKLAEELDRTPAANAGVQSLSDAQLAALYQTAVGTGCDDPGAAVVNGFTIEELEAETTRREARAAASQSIKTWQERCNWRSNEPATKLMVEAMKAEIADLRAALRLTAGSSQ